MIAHARATFIQGRRVYEDGGDNQALKAKIADRKIASNDDLTEARTIAKRWHQAIKHPEPIVWGPSFDQDQAIIDSWDAESTVFKLHCHNCNSWGSPSQGSEHACGNCGSNDVSIWQRL